MEQARRAQPQTSGGLAICIQADRADDALAELLELGHNAAIIGFVEPSEIHRGHATTLTLDGPG